LIQIENKGCLKSENIIHSYIFSRYDFPPPLSPRRFRASCMISPVLML